MKISEIVNGLGVKVEGIDLSSNLTPQIILNIQNLLKSKKVVVIKNQNLTDEELEKFAFSFGPAFVPDKKFPVLGGTESNSSIVIVGNQANEYSNSYLGHQEVLPHSDHQWLQSPSAASMLYAVDIGENSSPTIWFDMTNAYEKLNEQIKSKIKDLKLITYNPFYRPFGQVSSKYVNLDIDIPPGDIFSHPLVRTHPYTEEKILYMNIAYEVGFENIPYKEGIKLYLTLFDYIKNLDCKYEHKWENGDLVFWDNRATIHYRPSFGSDVRRVLKRLTLGGEIPF